MYRTVFHDIPNLDCWPKHGKKILSSSNHDDELYITTIRIDAAVLYLHVVRDMAAPPWACLVARTPRITDELPGPGNLVFFSPFFFFLLHRLSASTTFLHRAPISFPSKQDAIRPPFAPLPFLTLIATSTRSPTLPHPRSPLV